MNEHGKFTVLAPIDGKLAINSKADIIKWLH